jgi:hypothetical protein
LAVVGSSGPRRPQASSRCIANGAPPSKIVHARVAPREHALSARGPQTRLKGYPCHARLSRCRRSPQSRPAPALDASASETTCCDGLFRQTASGSLQARLGLGIVPRCQREANAEPAREVHPHVEQGVEDRRYQESQDERQDAARPRRGAGFAGLSRLQPESINREGGGDVARDSQPCRAGARGRRRGQRNPPVDGRELRFSAGTKRAEGGGQGWHPATDEPGRGHCSGRVI